MLEQLANFFFIIIIVTYSNGQKSYNDFHYKPDGAAVFAGSDGGWVYVSNSESSSDGGVGAIYFNSQGEVIKV